MKKRLALRTVALIMTFALFMGEGSIAMAAQSDNGLEAVEETAEVIQLEDDENEMVESEVSVEMEEETKEEIEEETEANDREDNLEEKLEQDLENSETEEITEVPVVEIEVVEESESVSMNELTVERLEELFPGLKEGSQLSSAQIASKKKLSSYINEIDTMIEGVDYVTDEVVVVAETEALAKEYAEAFGGTLKDYALGTAVITLEDKNGTGEISVASAVAASAKEELLLPAVWPNYYRYIVSSTNTYTKPVDPFLMENDESYQWFHNVIGSQQAWEAGYTGKGVKVAVLDTGILAGHQDVKAEVTLYASDSKNTITNGNDGNSHGTHVAGIINADKNNYGGVGIAYEADLISIKALNDAGRGDSFSIIGGLQLAIENGANIVNMSLAGPAYSEPEELAYQTVYEAGLAVFCAASNDSAQSEAYPASYRGTIAVAALDKNNHKASFSNYGSWVRYSAPGVDIFSTSVEFIGDVANTNNKEFYEDMSGTSQATPVVAGTAALLWNSVDGEGQTRVDNLLKLMDKSAIKVNGSGLGKGVVSLPKALGLDGVTTAPNQPVFSEKAGTKTVNQVEDWNIAITAGAGSRIYYTTNGKNPTYKNGSISDGAIPYTGAINIKDICDATGKGSVTLKAIAINENNQLASKVTTAKYTLKPKYASGVTVTSATGSNLIAKGKTIKLTATLSPVYVTDKSIQWTVDDNVAGITVKNGVVTVKSDTKDVTVSPGEYTIRATVKGVDGSYNGQSATFRIKVVEGNSQITSISVKPTNVTVSTGNSSGETVAVTVKKKDASLGNAEEITWSSADSTIASVTAKDNNLTIKGLKAGKTKITGVAKDGFGKSYSFNVTVTQPVTAINITSASGINQVAAGKSLSLKAEVLPSSSTNKKLSWSMEEDKYVKVNKTTGVVTVNAKVLTDASYVIKNQYTVTATAADGSNVTATYDFVVNKGKITGIFVGTDKKNPVKTETLFRVSNNFGALTEKNVNILVEGENTDNWTVTSSNKNLVEAIKSGNSVKVKATGKATGSATITVQSTDGTNIKKTFKVTVNNPATALHLAPEKGRSYCVAHKKTLKLSAVFETSHGNIDAKAKKLNWVSSNPSIASVDKNGSVKALTYVKTPVKITATATDGSGVSAEYIILTCGNVSGIEADGYSSRYNTIGVGYYREYPIRLYCPITHSGKLSWKLDYKVNKQGLAVYFDNTTGKLVVIGNKPGTYTVTLSMLDGNTAKKSYTFKVVNVKTP